MLLINLIKGKDIKVKQCKDKLILGNYRTDVTPLGTLKFIINSWLNLIQNIRQT